jgi:type IV fimbrial biogenesis protein FimT
MLNARRSRGFTLIELLVGMSIVAVIVGLGVPSLATFLQSTKLASAAKSYLIGVQTARTEAIRRNTQVEFLLTNSPVTAGVENAAALNANGANWVVRWFDPAAAAFALIEAKEAREGSASTFATPSVQIAGTANPGAFVGSIVFDGFGRTVTGDEFTLDLQNPAGGACAPAGPMRCPRIRVPPGGRIALCDPVAAAGDSRAC